MRVGLLSLEGLLIGTHAKVAMVSTLALNVVIQLVDELDERSLIEGNIYRHERHRYRHRLVEVVGF